MTRRPSVDRLIDLNIVLEKVADEIVTERDALPRGHHMRAEYRAVMRELQPLRTSLPEWIKHLEELKMTLNRVETPRDWTPVLSADGVHYCSPACGGGKFCKKADYDRAVADSDALARRMGDGWTTEVWENLGWHYTVGKGCITIHVNRNRFSNTDSYSAWIEPGGGIGNSKLQIIAHGKTPEDALGNAVQDVRTMIGHINDTLAVLNDVVAS